MSWGWKKHRVLWSLGIVVVLAIAYYSSGYFFVYNNDAYVSADWVRIATSVPGRIKHVWVKDNQFVKTGSPLLELEPKPFLLDIEQAKAQLNHDVAESGLLEIDIKKAHTDISLRESKLHLAEIEWQRFRTLQQDGAVSKERFDEKREQYQIAVAELKKARQTLTQLLRKKTVVKANIDRSASLLGLAEYHYSLSKLYAKKDGYINNLRVYEYDHADIGQVLFGFVYAGTWKIIANIKETNLVGIRPGKTVWVYLSSYPWHLFKGTVVSIAPGVARQPNPTDPALPYVKPVTDWIRYPYRIPVTIHLAHFPKEKPLQMGVDARIFALR